MTKRKPPKPEIEPLSTKTETKVCAGYNHHFSSEPLGMSSYVCQCGIFKVQLNGKDGSPLTIEPVADLNPDNKLTERVRNEPGR